MQIQNYRIRKYDKHNIVLEQQVKVENIDKTTRVKTGELCYKWVISGYYTKYNQAALAMRDALVHDGINDAESINDLIKTIEWSTEQILSTQYPNIKELKVGN